MTVHHALAEALESCMTRGRCRALDIVHEARRRHPELFLLESERLIVKGALRELRNIMRESSMTEEDIDSHNQPDLPLGILPGFVPPRALTVLVPDTENEFECVPYRDATWTDLTSVLHEKTVNIARAIARQADHQLKMDTLRPVLENYPARTVAEGCALLSKDAPHHGGPA